MADGPGAPHGTADGTWERYAAWEGHYRLHPWTAVPDGSARRPGLRRLVARLLVALLLLLVLGLVVKVVVAVVRWDLTDLVDVVLNPANALLLLGTAWLWWPPETRLTPSALVVRSEPWRTRAVAWDDVVEVQTPGRFDQTPVALLRGRERRALPGLPVGVAESMAAATRGEPTGEPSPSPRTPPPDGDLDGPFHRGPSRRSRGA